MMQNRGEIVFAIETAVQGGSLSLLENGVELDFWLGHSEVSRAEVVLEQTENLFGRNNLKKESLKSLIASSGPGSSTGIKIGLSFAMGLSKAIGCRFIQTPVLESFLYAADNNLAGAVVGAIPIGKDLICWQVFKSSELFVSQTEPPQISTAQDFIELITKRNYSQAVLHEKIFSLFLSARKNSSHKTSNKTLLVNAGRNLAKLLGASATSLQPRV